MWSPLVCAESDDLETVCFVDQIWLDIWAADSQCVKNCHAPNRLSVSAHFIEGLHSSATWSRNHQWLFVSKSKG